MKIININSGMNKSIKALIVLLCSILLSGPLLGQKTQSWQNKLNLGMSQEISRNKINKSALASAEKDKWADVLLYLSDENIDPASAWRRHTDYV